MAAARDDIFAIVHRAALRKLPLFAPFHELDLEDLVQQGVMAVLEAQSRFDPRKASFSTFVYCVASRQMLDLLRVRGRQLGHEQAHKTELEISAGRLRLEDDDGLPPPPAGLAWAIDPVQLAEWCALVYGLCRGIFRGRMRKVGWRHFKLAQVAAVVLVQRRLGLSSESMRLLLRERPAVREALHFRHAPPLAWLEKLAKIRPDAEVQDGTS